MVGLEQDSIQKVVCKKAFVRGVFFKEILAVGYCGHNKNMKHDLASLMETYHST